MKLRKKLARTLGLFIISALILSLIPFSALADDPVVLQGDGTEDSPYLISSKEELALLGDFTEKKYFRLTEDIEFEDGELWEPIDNFYGVLDGNGKTITGLTISEQNDTPAGLFRDIEVDAEVKNLNIVDANSVGVNYVGAIAGELYGKLTNCYVSGTVTAAISAGLLAGYSETAIIDNCSVSGSVSASLYGGGLVGYAYKTDITGCNASANVSGDLEFLGCLAGAVSESDIIDCSATGSITALSTSEILDVGGLAGYLEKSSVINSFADVDIDIDVDSQDSEETAERIGGFVGYADDSDIEDCQSICDISSKLSTVLTGGFCGRGYNKSSFKNCSAEGIVEVDNAASLIGGFIGGNDEDAEQLTLEGCYFNGEISVNRHNYTVNTQGIGGFIGGAIFGNVSLVDCVGEGEIRIYGELNPGNIVSGVGGFIGYVSESAVDIDTSYFEGSIYSEPLASGVGGFMGYARAEVTIENCFSICDIDSAGKEAGVFCGTIGSKEFEITTNTITDCYGVGKITGNNDEVGGFVGTTSYSIYYNCHTKSEIESGYSAGGFAAIADINSSFERCSAAGGINSDSGRSDNSSIIKSGINLGLGGFIGLLTFGSDVNDCFTTCDMDIAFTHEKLVDAGDNELLPAIKYIGGFCGINDDSEIENSYSAGRIKALISEAVAVEAVMPFASCEGEHTVSSCYYDKQKVGDDVDKETEIDGITGSTTAEMKKQSTFTDWDFEEVWQINDSYPEFIKSAVSGRVLSISDNPIPGADINITDDTVTTDSTGRYTLRLNNGYYKLKVPFKKPNTTMLLVYDGEEEDSGLDRYTDAYTEFDIHTDCILLGGEVSGIKSGDKVKVILKQGKNDIETKTYIAEDDTIDYLFIDVEDGKKYTLTVKCGGYEDKNLTVNIGNADSMDNDIKLSRIKKEEKESSGYGGFGLYGNAGNRMFTDLDNYSWAENDIYELAGRGVVNGTSYTTFSPGKPIKRADVIVMLVRGLGLTGNAFDNFDDVSPDKYYYYQVGIAKSLGIAKGYGNKFNPESYITRQDMMVLIVRALEVIGKKPENSAGLGVLDKFTDKGSISDYAKDAVAALVQNSLIVGSNSMINPKNNLTRAEAAVIINRVLKFIA